MACSTSMIGVLEAAAMLDGAHRSLALVGGVESLSHVQIGLSQSLSDWLRRFLQAKGAAKKFERLSALARTKIGLFVPSIANRSTAKSMGEHMEMTVRAMGRSRATIKMPGRSRATSVPWLRGSGAFSTIWWCRLGA